MSLVRWLAGLGVLALGGCIPIGLAPAFGSPCAEDGECPAPLVCGPSAQCVPADEEDGPDGGTGPIACPTGGQTLELEGQDELDRLECGADVDGDLVLQGVSDLAPLAGVESIDGDLVIQDAPDLEDLVPLARLTEISGTLELEGVGVTSLQSLSSLADLDGLQIQDVDGLQSLEGLGLSGALGELYIADNDALQSLAGLEALTTVGELRIENNDQLQSVTALCGLNTGLQTPAGISGDEACIVDNDALPENDARCIVEKSDVDNPDVMLCFSPNGAPGECSCF